MITFLDCTLRDGGYYNNWDFDPEKAKALVCALNEAKVDIVEIGYKSPVQENTYAGLFRNCNEDFLDFLSKGDYCKYCFMVDVKEFLTNNELDIMKLDKQIRAVDDSVFSMVRLASHYATIHTIRQFTDYFRRKGYKVGFNLMGGSLLTMKQVEEGIEVAVDSDVDVFYVADSFGSFYPEQVRGLIRAIRKKYLGKVGMHAHDNQGLAYANVLAAIEEGVDFVDGTVTGMGRGAGNLLTEQFLLGYSQKNPLSQYKPAALLSIIHEYFDGLKQQYKWGYNFTYMYSGLMNIHPTYCQILAESGRFNTAEINRILGSISTANRSKYSKTELEVAIAAILEKEVFGKTDPANLFNFDAFHSDEVVIVARGESVGKNLNGLRKLVAKRNAEIIECGDTGVFRPMDGRILVLLNNVRFEKWISENEPHNGIRLLTGHPATGIPKGYTYNYFPFSIGDFSVDEDQLIIPDYDSGLYAIAFAMRCGIRKIWLAGFDGFDNAELNKVKEVLFASIQREAETKGVLIQHITPTAYQVFRKNSLYTL